MIYILIICLGTFSCDSESGGTTSNTDSPRIIKKSKLVSPTNNATFVLGESIPFKIESNSEIDSVILVQDNLQAKYSNSSFDWVSLTNKVGKQKVRVTVYLGEKKETHYPKFTILSDITPENYGYKILNTYPHNPSSFTQGLFFYQDTLFESTGQTGESKLMKINLATGEPYQSKDLSNQYFGEGSTVWDNQIYYLTYTTQIGFKYDLNFNEIGEFRYPHQGWGITTMNDTLLVSDGSDIIRLIDPRDFSELGQIQVFDNEKSHKEINELEYFNGLVYANVWFKDYILAIDPKTGKVVQKIDLSGLLTRKLGNEDVLNGIAYNSKSNSIFVTGKLWLNLFELELIKN